MQVRTNIRAGGLNLNHNQTLVRDREEIRRLKVKTNVKAGGHNLNHNETLLRAVT
jgi:hypothetical protein